MYLSTSINLQIQLMLKQRVSVCKEILILVMVNVRCYISTNFDEYATNLMENLIFVRVRLERVPVIVSYRAYISNFSKIMQENLF